MIEDGLRGARGNRADSEGGLGRRQILLNALIPREVKVPEGSGGRRRSQPGYLAKLQRARSDEAAEAGANRHR